MTIIPQLRSEKPRAWLAAASIGFFAAFVPEFSIAAASASPPTQPPLRMGLWEQHHAQTLNGMDFDVPDFIVDQARRSGVDMASDGRSERLCITPQNIASIGQPNAAALPACHKENIRLSGKSLDLKLVCRDETGAGEGQVHVIFDGPTYYHGTFAFTGTHQLFGDNMLPLEFAGKVTGRWLSPSCAAPR
jgi:hypothetical protein